MMKVLLAGLLVTGLSGCTLLAEPEQSPRNVTLTPPPHSDEEELSSSYYEPLLLDVATAEFSMPSEADTNLNPDASAPGGVADYSFARVNGVALVDTADEVLEKLGFPLELQHDEVLPEREDYVYEQMTIGFAFGELDYILIPSTAATFELGDRTLPVDLAQLLELLGTPDFEAEDGWVYVHKEEHICLKLFVDMDTGELSSIQLYWLY